MNDAIAVQSWRISTLTSVIRTRKEDALRLLTHGGTLRDLETREEAVVAKLEKIADRLEKQL